MYTSPLSIQAVRCVHERVCGTRAPPAIKHPWQMIADGVHPPQSRACVHLWKPGDGGGKVRRGVGRFQLKYRLEPLQGCEQVAHAVGAPQRLQHLLPSRVSVRLGVRVPVLSVMIMCWVVEGDEGGQVGQVLWKGPGNPAQERDKQSTASHSLVDWWEPLTGPRVRDDNMLTHAVKPGP
jgi:hypothetical protein